MDAFPVSCGPLEPAGEATRQQAGRPRLEGRVAVGYAGNAVRCLGFSRDGSLLASAGDDKLLCVWAVPALLPPHSSTAETPLACLKRM